MNGVKSELVCGSDVDSATIVDQVFAESFKECIELCSGTSDCTAVEYQSQFCTLLKDVSSRVANTRVDVSFLVVG